MSFADREAYLKNSLQRLAEAHSNVLKENEMLSQQLAEAQALIGASQKQVPLAWFAMKYEYGYEYLEETIEGATGSIPVFAAPVVAPDVLKDAQRYQWLREYLPSTDMSVDDDLVAALNPQEIDAAIDKAMGGAND